MTEQGKVAGGDFIAVIRGIDWLQARMQERIFTVLTQNEKVPFTDAGGAILEAEIRGQLLDGVSVGLIGTPSEFTVNVPHVADIPQADRANRNFTGITFTARLAGAVHAVLTNGVVTV